MAKQEGSVLTPEEEKEDDLSDILSYDPDEDEKEEKGEAEKAEKEDDLSDVLPGVEEEDLSDLFS